MLILCAEFFRLEDFHLHLSLLHIPSVKDRLFWIDVSISCQLVQVSCLYWKSLTASFWNHLYQKTITGHWTLCQDLVYHLLSLTSGFDGNDVIYCTIARVLQLRPSNIIALCCKNKCLMNTRGDKMRVVSTLSGKKANRFWWSPLIFIELIWKIL